MYSFGAHMSVDWQYWLAPVDSVTLAANAVWSGSTMPPMTHKGSDLQITKANNVANTLGCNLPLFITSGWLCLTWGIEKEINWSLLSIYLDVALHVHWKRMTFVHDVMVRKHSSHDLLINIRYMFFLKKLSYISMGCMMHSLWWT
jgi:hypothetical protein